jgi:hypothetical protein
MRDHCKAVIDTKLLQTEKPGLSKMKSVHLTKHIVVIRVCRYAARTPPAV